jgi:glycosyltransferase involved in cell wall biosynthesis
MTSAPKVSVVMPAHNAAAYLNEAVSSILAQTFRDFEFIIIDDGSTDATASILKQYAELDSRLQVHHQENQGMISALNRGCRLARGEYIARMDADDISYAYRLERQLEYLARHPHIGVVGTWTRVTKNGSEATSWCPSTNAKSLKWELFFGVCVAHPSVMMRRDIVAKLNFYRTEAEHIEDVDLWLRASSITEFGNVPEMLYEYRVWSGSTSQLDQELRRRFHVRLLAAHVGEFLQSEPPVEGVIGLRRTRVGPPPENLEQILLTASLIQRLYDGFVERNHLTSEERQEIAWDAAKKVGALALQASRIDVWKSVPLLMQAMKLDCRVVSPTVIATGIKNVFRNRSAVITDAKGMLSL